MSDDLVFYTNPMSRGRIVRWMLEEVGAPYRTEVLQYAASMKAPQYLAINPMGKVPAIVHKGAVVTECAAICAYLADAFPDAGLAPRSDAERAAYYRWLFYAAGPIEAAVTAKSMNLLAPSDKAMSAGYGSFEAFLEREIDLGKQTSLKLIKIAHIFQQDAALDYGMDRLFAAISALEGESTTPKPSIPSSPGSKPMLPLKPPMRIVG